jgi:glycosyltransferase involved in cell wall biosynthesis
MTRVLLVPDLPLERWPAMDRYASRLVHHLDGQTDDLEFSVATKIGKLTVEERKTDSADRKASPRPLPNEPRLSPAQLRRYFMRFWLYPRRVRRMHADLLHILDHTYAHILRDKKHKKRRPAVITVHDMMPMLMLERPAPALRRRLRNWLLSRSLAGLRRANAWIVATDWLKGELAEWLGHDEGIHTIPYGVDDDYFLEPERDPVEIRQGLGIPESAFVVLHVGSVDARKNLSAVIASVQGLRDRGVEAWLLQVGDAFTPEQQADLESKDIGEFTIAVGHTSEGNLRLAYRAAHVLLFPSHHEGVGLPVLEAMASGLPVVTSGAAGLKEVAGDAAIVVAAREAEPYVEELKRLAEDSELRASLVERGLEHAARYRWVDAARRTVEVYRTLV